MPVIRFLRENRDVECYPGENLRAVALREGIGLYGLKGILGNCGGCGQCITCFVEIPEGNRGDALSGRTVVEEQKLRRRPGSWRLACQSQVQHSLVVITRPQLGLGDKDAQVAAALAAPLPPGPTTWPEPPAAEAGAEDLPQPVGGAEDGPGSEPSAGPATSDELP